MKSNLCIPVSAPGNSPGWLDANVETEVYRREGCVQSGGLGSTGVAGKNCCRQEIRVNYCASGVNFTGLSTVELKNTWSYAQC